MTIVTKSHTVLRDLDIPDIGDFEVYLKHGGYESLRVAIKDKTPADVTQLVKDAGLRGRGWGKRLEQLIEQRWRERLGDGQLALSFEIVYGHAFRPVPKTTAAGESIIRFERPPR